MMFGAKVGKIEDVFQHNICVVTVFALLCCKNMRQRLHNTYTILYICNLSEVICFDYRRLRITVFTTLLVPYRVYVCLADVFMRLNISNKFVLPSAFKNILTCGTFSSRSEASNDGLFFYSLFVLLTRQKYAPTLT
jgi:hypothetical protein